MNWNDIQGLVNTGGLSINPYQNNSSGAVTSSPQAGPFLPGTSTYGTQSAPAPAPSGGGGGSVLGTNTTSNPQPQSQSSGPSIPDLLTQGYNSYQGELDQILNSLPGQKTNLETQAREATSQQQSDLDLQKTQGDEILNTYQNKTLRDLAANIRNLFRSGQVMLGARGAGDSSATNQYAFGLTKFGTQQRTNVMQDVSQRLGNLNNIYNTETNKLKSAFNQKVSEIAQWFSEQQNALRGQKVSAVQQWSQQALDIAMQQLNSAQQQAVQQRSILDQWVANHATNIKQVIDGMQQNTQNVAMPEAFPGLNIGANSFNPAAIGYGNTTEEKKKTLFG